VEKSLPFVGGRPLRTADEVFAARFRRIRPAAGIDKPLDEGLLLIRLYGIHRRRDIISRAAFDGAGRGRYAPNGMRAVARAEHHVKMALEPYS
jgi:hypothetical protein